MQASVDRRYTAQSIVEYRHDHQDFSVQHHDLRVNGGDSFIAARRMIVSWPASNSQSPRNRW
jgi:hypothetical protein